MRFLHPEKGVTLDPDQTLKVIAAGLPRCATSSLQAALDNELGYAPCMHMAHVAPFADRLKLSYEALLETDKPKRQAILHKLFDGYAATCDFPGSFFLDDLLEMYPDAKVILNKRRSPEAWHRSIVDTIQFYSTRTYLWTTCLSATDYWHFYCHMALKKQAERRFGCDSLFNIEMYNLHNDWVKDVAAKQGKEVLDWEPSMGWDPLCKFLDKPVPKTSFPHINDTQNMKVIRLFLIQRGLLKWVAVLSVPVVALGAYFWMM